jgi:hypothetical protein
MSDLQPTTDALAEQAYYHSLDNVPIEDSELRERLARALINRSKCRGIGFEELKSFGTDFASMLRHQSRSES